MCALYSGHFHPKKLPTKPLPSLALALDPESKINFPSQKVLYSVVCHRRWLDCLAAAKAADAVSGATVKHREATRFISISQPAAGAPFEIAPDGTYPTTHPVARVHRHHASPRRARPVGGQGAA